MSEFKISVTFKEGGQSLGLDDCTQYYVTKELNTESQSPYLFHSVINMIRKIGLGIKVEPENIKEITIKRKG